MEYEASSLCQICSSGSSGRSFCERCVNFKVRRACQTTAHRLDSSGSRSFNMGSLPGIPHAVFVSKVTYFDQQSDESVQDYSQRVGSVLESENEALKIGESSPVSDTSIRTKTTSQSVAEP